jgi:hypothetical protein
VAFGEEEVEGIGLAAGQSQSVEGDRSRHRRVQPPEVNRETPIDKDPEVVVAGKLKDFAALVGKRLLGAPWIRCMSMG